MFLKHFVFWDHSHSLRARLSAAVNQSTPSQVALVLLSSSSWGCCPQSRALQNSSAAASHFCEAFPLPVHWSCFCSQNLLLCLGKYAKRTSVNPFNQALVHTKRLLIDVRRCGWKYYACCQNLIPSGSFTWRYQLVLDSGNDFMVIRSTLISKYRGCLLYLDSKRRDWAGDLEKPSGFPAAVAVLVSSEGFAPTLLAPGLCPHRNPGKMLLLTHNSFAVNLLSSK